MNQGYKITESLAMEPFELAPGYVVRSISIPEWGAIYHQLVQVVFPSSTTIPLDGLYTEEEHVAFGLLNSRLANVYRLQWVIEHNSQTVGWTFGHQERDGIFLMRNSGIVPEHRRKGLYSALLPHVINCVRSDGFRLIRSQHHCSNNAVLIPKLKAGFIITGITVSDKHGVLVELTYPLHPSRLDVYRYRIGEIPYPLPSEH